MEPGTNRSPAEAPREGPLEGVRARSGEGVAPGVREGLGAVPVGLSAMSSPEPQFGQARSSAAIGVEHAGQVDKGKLRAYR
jgi:hypothetical protein